jgi:hypothetical protein
MPTPPSTFKKPSKELYARLTAAVSFCWKTIWGSIRPLKSCEPLPPGLCANWGRMFLVPPKELHRMPPTAL